MKVCECSKCGATEFKVEGRMRICAYCGTTFILESGEYQPNNSSIGISSDVNNLLRKCKFEPWNARKYANRILDIEPHNKEALKYLE